MSNTDTPPDGGNAEQRAERGDAILRRLADAAVADYGAKGVVTMVVFPDHSLRYFQQGLTHAQVNNALAVGIHMNMTEHDRKVAQHQAEQAAAAAETGKENA